MNEAKHFLGCFCERCGTAYDRHTPHYQKALMRDGHWQATRVCRSNSEYKVISDCPECDGENA